MAATMASPTAPRSIRGRRADKAVGKGLSAFMLASLARARLARSVPLDRGDDSAKPAFALRNRPDFRPEYGRRQGQRPSGAVDGSGAWADHWRSKLRIG